MEEIKRIEQAVRNRQTRKYSKFVQIGRVAEQYMMGQVVPLQKKYGDVVEVWEQVLPEELFRHCEIVDISGGNLSVKVDSPSHKYELHLCSSEILKELQKECPKTRLTRIKLL